MDITIDRTSLGYSNDAEASDYAAWLANYLDAEMGGDHRVLLGDGGRPPSGYEQVLRDAWTEWCNR